jgi:hypothetical protein
MGLAGGLVDLPVIAVKSGNSQFARQPAILFDATGAPASEFQRLVRVSLLAHSTVQPVLFRLLRFPILQLDLRNRERTREVVFRLVYSNDDA